MKYTPKFKQVPLNQGGGSLVANPVLPTAGLYNTNRTAFVDSTLKANKNLEWVKRLYPTFKKSMEVFPGFKSTHLMGDNGRGYVYPHIIKENSKLKYMPTDDEAGEYAKQTNTGIQFKTPEQGTWFSNNGYKLGSGVFNKNYKPNKVY